jgi:hypothetical protein
MSVNSDLLLVSESANCPSKLYPVERILLVVFVILLTLTSTENLNPLFVIEKSFEILKVD